MSALGKGITFNWMKPSSKFLEGLEVQDAWERNFFKFKPDRIFITWRFLQTVGATLLDDLAVGEWGLWCNRCNVIFSNKRKTCPGCDLVDMRPRAWDLYLVGLNKYELRARKRFARNWAKELSDDDLQACLNKLLEREELTLGDKRIFVILLNEDKKRSRKLCQV